MTRFRALIAPAAGFALATLLIALLLRISGVTAVEIVTLMASARPAPVVGLVLATALHIFLSAEKWRLVETRLGHAPTRSSAFAYSAIGTAAGQLLPIQAANALVRGLGTRLGGRGSGVRGAMSSLWEQAFDLWVVLVLALPAALALARGDSAVMLLAAPALAAGAAPLLVAPGLAARLAACFPHGRLGRAARSLAEGGLLERRLMLQLYGLSMCRIAILWLMAWLVASALSLPVAGPDLAAALPFAVLGSVLSMLPAGIGANELSFVAVLSHLGTPIAIATSWALINRLLVAQASILVGLAGMLLLAVTQGRGRPLARS